MAATTVTVTTVATMPPLSITVTIPVAVTTSTPACLARVGHVAAASTGVTMTTVTIIGAVVC
jgi:hypothetical protein